MKTPAEVAAEMLEAMQIPDGQRCTFTRDGKRCVNPRLAPDSVFCPGHAYLYGDAKESNREAAKPQPHGHGFNINPHLGVELPDPDGHGPRYLKRGVFVGKDMKDYYIENGIVTLAKQAKRRNKKRST